MRCCHVLSTKPPRFGKVGSPGLGSRVYFDLDRQATLKPTILYPGSLMRLGRLPVLLLVWCWSPYSSTYRYAKLPNPLFFLRTVLQ